MESTIWCKQNSTVWCQGHSGERYLNISFVIVWDIKTFWCQKLELSQHFSVKFEIKTTRSQHPFNKSAEIC